MKALIDADIVLFRAAFSAEDDTEDVAVTRANVMVSRILDTISASEYQLWLSDKRENNFRSKLAPSYKANRTKPPPIHYKAVRQFLEEKWGALVTPEQEADDALGISQCCGNGNTVICSIDKDLLQIPGKHFNFVSGETCEITYQQGIAHFYQQLLTGDRTDNISSGIKRMGTAKAQGLLAYCEGEEDMLEIAKSYYNDDEKLLLNGRLLWIRRKPQEVWNIPKYV